MASQFRDPFDHLPLELAVMVLKQFDFRQIVYVGSHKNSKKTNNICSPILTELPGQSCAFRRNGNGFFPHYKSYGCV